MTKARDLSKLLSTSNGKIAGSNLDVSFENISDTGTEGTKVASGTTAQRGSTTGQWRFNTTTGYFEGRNNAGDFSTLEPTPTVTGVDVTEVDSQAGGNQTIVVTGTNFSSGGTISFVGSSAQFNASTTTYNSATQVTAVAPKASFLNAQEPYKVKFTSSSGVAGSSATGLINVDSAPTFGVASGSLGTLPNGNRSASGLTTVTATDAEGDAITFAKTAGTLPTGITLNSNGTWSGTANSESSNTTYNFTITATANSKTTSRAYSITVNALQILTFSYTGSGQTFTAPSGVTSFTAYMWGAGGAGGSTENGITGNGGDGGAGGYVTSTISNFSAGQAFGILVGQSNESDNTTVVRSFGGGGNGGAKLSQRIGGAGGGRSEINIGTVGNTPNGTRILVAGGGGGGNARYSNLEYTIHANATGGTTGANGNEPSGQSGTPPTGGTQSAGGNAGTGQQQGGRPASELAIAGVAGIGGYATGGNVEVDTSYGAGGGGGGGYYGGGGGDGGLTPGGSGNSAHSGAGGSSYANTSYCSNVTHGTGSGKTAPQTGNTYYGSSAGVGGSGKNGIGSSGTAGGHGRVVIVY